MSRKTQRNRPSADARPAATGEAAAARRSYRSIVVGIVMAVLAIVGLSAQAVIFVSTALSYLLGLNTFFNTPAALNATEPVAFGAAMGGRADRGFRWGVAKW